MPTDLMIQQKQSREICRRALFRKRTGRKNKTICPKVLFRIKKVKIEQKEVTMLRSRRSFLRTAATAGTGVALQGTSPLFAAETAGGKSEVYVGKGKASEIITKIVDSMGGMGHYIKKGARVVIKPNMSFSNPPDWGTTTSPEAVRTVAQLCLDAGASKVLVCDNVLREVEACKSKTGIADAVKDMKGVVVFVPKQESMYVEKKSEKAKQLTRIKVLKELGRADVFISLPAAKSHSAAGVSLGLKGMMGLVYNRSAYHREMDLHTAIAEQLYYMKPTLSIIDATRALLDNGPGGPGKVVKLDTFVGGLDPVAVDSYAVTLASWYGKQFEGTNVKYLKIASELGFGNVASDSIKEIAV
ncbi:MAG: DUF362 domain-containing protein [Chitinivibrionales bacterium]|nr:DUF362 domain-containing protein [Chitinivibrionales bacterium]